MSYFNGRTYFLAAVYHTRGNFSHLPRFLNKVAGHFSCLPYQREPVLEKVQQLRQEYDRISSSIDQEEALKIMVGRDLEAVEQILRDDLIVADIDQRENIEDVLDNCLKKALDLLQSLGVQIEKPGIVFVDALPAPYSRRGYSALTADGADSEQYNISPGIYFPLKRLRPFYSEFLLMHELIHVALGQADPYLLARGLEEGLAELIGAMYLSSRVLGPDLTINLFIYNRLSADYERFWELYMDATRQATLLHQRFGLRSVCGLLNQGRERVKQIENYCLHMRFDKIDMPRSKPDPELDDMAGFLSLIFSRNLIVSPLARYLSSYVRTGHTLGQILQEARVERDAGMDALRELEESVNLASYSNEGRESEGAIVNWSDCERLSEGSIIRYDIPT